MAPVQPQKPITEATTEPDAVSEKWLLARIQEMKARRLAGAFPEDCKTILNRLGYDDYGSYLYSPLWRKIRRRILKRDGSTCVRCDERATQVHHLTYTEAALRGEGDSQLVSVCATCHDKIEFDENRDRRSEREKRRVLEDREGAQQEKIAAEEAWRHLQETKARVCIAAGGRCFWCKGNTEYWWKSDGSVYTLPTADGQPVDGWICSECFRVLEHDKEGHPRTDEQKLVLLRKKAMTRYTRPDPRNPGISFNKAFWKLNAIQREGIMNEFDWNQACKKPDLETTDPKRFAELKARYESTKHNGRDRKAGPNARSPRAIHVQ